MSEEDNVRQFGAVAMRQRRTPTNPSYREVVVAGRLHRVVHEPNAPNGFKWYALVGQTVGIDTWVEVQPPATRDVIAALYEAVRTN